ncbi:hypothetical protein DVH24_000960 [Malus domestica]|uniref:Uncharacterized protein n=1 Tax=Malus domestica TaxID=3750 RepID=A0A498JZW9_MALDO|nr:hypothetical protein DVH24_000960 [Malus domestica]
MLIVHDSPIFHFKSTPSVDLPDSLRYLYWRGYPLESLPLKFSPENLVDLHMPCSQVKKLWKEDQRLVNLQVLNLPGSIYLTEVPNLSGSLKIVNIDLSSCRRLVEIPWYFQDLDRLTHLCLRGCTSLKYLPEMPRNIKHLNLSESGIKELPQSVWSHEKISYLNISHCSDLEKLPSNICKLKVSGSFDLVGCESLVESLSSIPKSICKLKYLEELDLSWCSKLENFPEILEPMEDLQCLKLCGTVVQELHLSVKFLPALQWNSLFSEAMEDFRNSISLRAPNFENFLEILKPMEHLKFLNLIGTSLEALHSSIEMSLKSMDQVIKPEANESDDHGCAAGGTGDDSDF